MKLTNTEIHKKIEKNKKLFTAIRRADIALQIRNQMVEKGIRNVDLAERLGVSEANISRWLRGNQNVSIDALYMLADAIEEKLSIFIGDRSAVARGANEKKRDCIWEDEGSVNESHENVVSMSIYRGYKELTGINSRAKFRPALSTHNIVSTGGFDERAIATA
ncbi:helix-turn-helix transcriptional regulator [Variovorax paradoxus]|uniref:helix-turn-helix domain-containing protein n=1 Tax=Variovorax paradoxus TaxID=34073 RepID=UPI0021AC2BBE|nr:helix-turn-helix transcriptional regulator [Variovorax paradoxus]UVH56511.1 helix-turn-helix transcriptional regulator [Variovorax paradoxus]